jgi:hypothetical protein
MQEALEADREHVTRWLDALVEELISLREALKDGQEPRDLFVAAAEARARWLGDRQTPVEAIEAPELPQATRRRFPF